jgi:hypothetical protein
MRNEKKKCPRGGTLFMKKIIAVVVVVLVIGFAGLLPAQESKGPKIIAKEVQYDFGKVVEGTVASHVFEIRNGGNEPLDIERIMPS